MLFDSHGNLNLEYDPSTMFAFNNASNCIHQQYSAYSINGMNVDADLTLGENIADQGGLRFTEIAYENLCEMRDYFDFDLETEISILSSMCCVWLAMTDFKKEGDPFNDLVQEHSVIAPAFIACSRIASFAIDSHS